MIPRAYIDAWRQNAPWQQDSQVEQDLVISRALIQIFSHDLLRDHLVFRGGTALHKLFLHPAVRYSEDIDLVQLRPGPIKPLLEALRDQLLFLGDKDDRQIAQKEHNNTIYYNFQSEIPPQVKLKLKIEINTREHFRVLDLNGIPFSVGNPWYQGKTDIITFKPEELLGTKLRALYQRKKGRDLFDLHYALTHLEPDIKMIIRCFREYIEQNGNRPPSGREFELNMENKLKDPEFRGDIEALLRTDIEYDQYEAYDHIHRTLIRSM